MNVTNAGSFTRLRDVDWLRPSVIALLVANCVPLVGVLFLGWEVFPLVLLFWIENVIVGIFNVLRMIFAGGGEQAGQAAKFFLIPFFVAHYGIFTFVHGMFVILMFGGGGFRSGPGPGPGLHAISAVIRENHLGWAVLGLAVSHGVSFVQNYLLGGEARRTSVFVLMMQPYSRVVALHVTILLGGLLVAALHSPTLGLVVLTLLKVGLDLNAHLRERRRFNEGSTPGPVRFSP